MSDQVASDPLVASSLGAWWDAAICSVREQTGQPHTETLGLTDFMCAHGLLVGSLQRVGMASAEDQASYDDWAVDIFHHATAEQPEEAMTREGFEEYLLAVAAENMDVAATPAAELASLFNELLELTGAHQRNGLLWGSSHASEEQRVHSYR